MSLWIVAVNRPTGSVLYEHDDLDSALGWIKHRGIVSGEYYDIFKVEDDFTITELTFGEKAFERATKHFTKKNA